MSLRTRLLAAFAYVLVLVIVALEVPLGLNTSRRVDAEVRAEAAGQAHLVAAGASGRLGDAAALGRLVAGAGRDLRGRVILVDRQGLLLADSAGSGLRLAPYGSRPEIAEALAGGTAQGIRHSADLDQDLLFTAVPIVEAGRRVGAVRVTQSVEAVQSAVRRDLLGLVGVGGLALLLGLGVAWLLAGSLARPLRGLAAAARRVASGELDRRAEVTGSREHREVAMAFNEMTARLAAALGAQREFVANASHQLRTPLTGLQLRLESARLRSNDPGLDRDLAAAERETQRLARLLAELLALARGGERPPAPADVDVAEAVAAARERWEPTAAASGHVLETAEAPELHVAVAGTDLAIVLDNLIENALRYSPAGTPVTVGWARGDGLALLTVEDRGAGLAPGEEHRVFERFYRGGQRNGHPEGTGLGLAIVAALVERWGGSAAAANRSGGGARIELRLPLAPAPAAPGRGSDERQGVRA